LITLECPPLGKEARVGQQERRADERLEPAQANQAGERVEEAFAVLTDR
jgi:hypothetical protein